MFDMRIELSEIEELVFKLVSEEIAPSNIPRHLIEDVRAKFDEMVWGYDWDEFAPRMLELEEELAALS